MENTTRMGEWQGCKERLACICVHRRGHKRVYMWARARATDSRCARKAQLSRTKWFSIYFDFSSPHLSRTRDICEHKGNRCARRLHFVSTNIRRSSDFFLLSPAREACARARERERGSRETHNTQEGKRKFVSGRERKRKRCIIETVQRSRNFISNLEFCFNVVLNVSFELVAG